MLGSLNHLRGFRVEATDGPIGKVEDFFFDDAAWTIRYLVVDTGGWLTGRQVLISPVSLGHPDRQVKTFPVALTKAQVENSPAVETEQPVSRRHEIELASYFGWPSYWSGADFATAPPAFTPVKPPPESEPPRGDPHLESARTVAGYHILATDGEIGHVDDFLADDQNWVIRYIVVDTRNWLPGKKVLLAPQWIRQVDWLEMRVSVDLPRQRIHNSPAYDHSAPVTREYEAALYDYYGVPPYWG